MLRMSARRSIGILVGAIALPIALAPPAIAQSSATMFALICASSIGFDGLDRDACGRSVLGGDPVADSRKEQIGIETLVAEALAGNTIAERIFEITYTGGVALPLVPLNADPCDRFVSSGGDGCSSTPAAPRLAAFGPRFPSLNETLTDEQEALLGCGPFWGTDCERDGIDLENAERSVLLQSWPGFEGSVAGARWENGQLVVLPGARGPGQQGYVPTVDGCTAADVDPRCDLAQPLVTPTNTFANEMAALSWNFLMTLVAFSQPPAGEAPGIDELDPADPMRSGVGQCSFAQPQYCSSVISFLALPEPDALLASATAALALALARARARRS